MTDRNRTRQAWLRLMLLAGAALLAGCGTRTDASVSPTAGTASSVVAIINEPKRDTGAIVPELITSSDGVPELHVRTQRPYRIIVHKRTPKGEPRTTTILLNGANGSASAD